MLQHVHIAPYCTVHGMQNLQIAKTNTLQYELCVRSFAAHCHSSAAQQARRNTHHKDDHAVIIICCTTSKLGLIDLCDPKLLQALLEHRMHTDS